MDVWLLLAYIVIIVVAIAGIGWSSDAVSDELPPLVKRAGLPAAVISIVGIAMATALPEIIISISGVAIAGDVYAVVPAMVGSSLMHFLIIGVIAIATPVFLVRPRQVNITLIATMAIAAVLFALALIFNTITYIPVIILLLFFAVYTAIAVGLTRRESLVVTGRGNGAKALVGFAVLLIGSVIFIFAIDGINQILALDSTEVGFFMVGFAANLPEFILVGTAAVKARPDIAIAGAISGNIVNIALGIGLTGIIAPLPVTSVPLLFAIGGLIFIACVALVMTWTGRRITRWEGISLVLIYFAIIVIFIVL